MPSNPAQLRRFYFPELSSELAEQQLPNLARHFSVLRLEGASVMLFDGQGRVRLANVNSDADGNWTATYQASATEVTPRHRIHLVVALPKGKKLETVVKMVTEVGVSTIHPVVSDHCVSAPDASRFEKRLVRLQRIVEEAARQSERAFVPVVYPLRPLSNTMEDIPKHATACVCVARQYEGAVASMDIEEGVDTWVFVGPEGGFSDKERTRFTEQNIQAWCLIDTVMRVETACVVAVAALRRQL